ncbi:hypothetical protein C8R48DRAFT_672814 [Suillus tomentosus]|nr:hypothetical protein C8R48DRAFT_672814 [Suillus tomentosus]
MQHNLAPSTVANLEVEPRKAEGANGACLKYYLGSGSWLHALSVTPSKVVNSLRSTSCSWGNTTLITAGAGAGTGLGVHGGAALPRPGEISGLRRKFVRLRMEFVRLRKEIVGLGKEIIGLRRVIVLLLREIVGLGRVIVMLLRKIVGLRRVIVVLLREVV